MKNNTDTHLVSIIIPCYNSADWVGETITSCLQQTYRDIEVIVIDDGSTDYSLEVLASFYNQIYFETGPNRGANFARNRGMELASGQYLMFLDADDIIREDTIKVLVDALIQTNKEIALGNWCHLVQKEDGKWVPEFVRVAEILPQNDDLLAGWLNGWYVPPAAVMWLRDTVEKLGGWDNDLTANQDGDLMMRALINDAKVIRVRDGLSYYRQFHKRKTTSQTISITSLQSRKRVLDKVEKDLREVHKLDMYNVYLGKAYHGLGARSYKIAPQISDDCFSKAWQLAGRASYYGSQLHRLLCSIFGVRITLWLKEHIHSVGIKRQPQKRLVQKP